MKQRLNAFSDEELLAAYNETPQLNKIAVKFKVPVITVWRRAKRLGLVFAKNGGSGSVKYNLHDILSGKHPQYGTNKLRIRLLKEGIMKNICSECGITEYNNKPITMELDHIDGDPSNHIISNLRLLCPNCHSQTPTYCGRNK